MFLTKDIKNEKVRQVVKLALQHKFIVTRVNTENLDQMYKDRGNGYRIRKNRMLGWDIAMDLSQYLKVSMQDFSKTMTFNIFRDCVIFWEDDELLEAKTNENLNKLEVQDIKDKVQAWVDAHYDEYDSQDREDLLDDINNNAEMYVDMLEDTGLGKSGRETQDTAYDILKEIIEDHSKINEDIKDITNFGKYVTIKHSSLSSEEKEFIKKLENELKIDLWYFVQFDEEKCFIAKQTNLKQLCEILTSIGGYKLTKDGCEKMVACLNDKDNTLCAFLYNDKNRDGTHIYYGDKSQIDDYKKAYLSINFKDITDTASKINEAAKKPSEFIKNIGSKYSPLSDEEKETVNKLSNDLKIDLWYSSFNMRNMWFTNAQTDFKELCSFLKSACGYELTEEGLKKMIDWLNDRSHSLEAYRDDSGHAIYYADKKPIEDWGNDLLAAKFRDLSKR